MWVTFPKTDFGVLYLQTNIKLCSPMKRLSAFLPTCWNSWNRQSYSIGRWKATGGKVVDTFVSVLKIISRFSGKSWKKVLRISCSIELLLNSLRKTALWLIEIADEVWKLYDPHLILTILYATLLVWFQIKPMCFNGKNSTSTSEYNLFRHWADIKISKIKFGFSLDYLSFLISLFLTMGTPNLQKPIWQKACKQPTLQRIMRHEGLHLFMPNTCWTILSCVPVEPNSTIDFEEFSLPKNS